MKHLLKIINQDVQTLNGLVEHFVDKGLVSSIEIDLALRKVSDIYNELLMLKPETGEELIDLNPKVELVKEEPKAVPEVKREATIEEPLLVIKENFVEENLMSELVQNNKVEPEKEEVEGLEPETLSETIVKEDETQVHSKVEVIQPKVVEAERSIPKSSKKENEMPMEEPTKVNPRIADTFSDAAPSLNDIQAGVNKHKYLAAQFKDKPIDKLTKAIKINDRIWFINELFSKDVDAYNSTLKVLDDMKNLDDALAYIFKNFQWDQEKKSTIGFLELVFRRFAEQN